MKNVGLLLSVIFLSGCATYQSNVGSARLALQTGNYTQALAELKPLAEKEDKDQLVYLLDYAMALQASGDFSLSNKYFLKADKLQDELDYYSVSKIAGSLVTSEEVKQYKGDTFEKIFINAQLALNFLSLGDLDSALVESRRINQKYQKLRADEDSEIKLNPFAKYLSALIWEATQKYDDAAIAYQDTYKISPDLPGLREDLLRANLLAKRETDYQKWKKQFPDAISRANEQAKADGELIIISQLGWGPRKDFDPVDYRWPVLVSQSSNVKALTVQLQSNTYQSAMIYDVDEAARTTLMADRASLLARRMAGIVAKDAVAQRLQKEDPLLGAVAWIAMHVSDRADLRQWSTLPASIHLLRIPLDKGEHQVQILGVGYGNETLQALQKNVKISRKGEKKFLVLRFF